MLLFYSSLFLLLDGADDVVLVAGGWFTPRSVEVVDITGRGCPATVPDLPEPRHNGLSVMVVGGSVLVCGGWEERVRRSCIVNEEPWRAGGGGGWSRHSVTNYRHVGAAGAVVGGSVLLWRKLTEEQLWL